MKIHCIHDMKHEERYDLLQKEILSHGLDLQLWPAKNDPVMTFRAISRAHKQIVAWAMMQKLPMVCIAEDDFHITAPGAWQYFLDHIPVDFDLYLSGVYCGFIKTDNTTDDFCGLHLYIVHNRFYREFLSIPEDQNLDRALCKRGRFVVVDQFCAVQHDGFSYNKGRIAEYAYLLKGRKMCCS